jgi:hypothetical protein
MREPPGTCTAPSATSTAHLLGAATVAPRKARTVCMLAACLLLLLPSWGRVSRWGAGCHHHCCLVLPSALPSKCASTPVPTGLF